MIDLPAHGQDHLALETIYREVCKATEQPQLRSYATAERYSKHMAIDLIERIREWEFRNNRMIGALTAENLIKNLYDTGEST